MLEVAKLADAKIIPPDIDVTHRLLAGGIIVAFTYCNSIITDSILNAKL